MAEVAILAETRERMEQVETQTPPDKGRGGVRSIRVAQSVLRY